MLLTLTTTTPLSITTVTRIRTTMHLAPSVKMTLLTSVLQLVDIAAGTLPHFSLVVPTQAQDNHDVTTNYTAIFMQQFMTDLMMGPDFVNSRVLVHITYDEGKR